MLYSEDAEQPITCPNCRRKVRERAGKITVWLAARIVAEHMGKDDCVRNVTDIDRTWKRTLGIVKDGI